MRNGKVRWEKDLKHFAGKKCIFEFPCSGILITKNDKLICPECNIILSNCRELTEGINKKIELEHNYNMSIRNKQALPRGDWVLNKINSF